MSATATLPETESPHADHPPAAEAPPPQSNTGGGAGDSNVGTLPLPQPHALPADEPPSRRVTISHNAASDPRRGSLGSLALPDADWFSSAAHRRNSFGLGGMEHFFRRDSLDSSTLDMAILDLSRRRYSAAGLAPPPELAAATSSLSSFGAGGFLGGPPPGVQQFDSIAQRQQQLQQQQRELEQRQKELEFQRQQLIASMQERSYGPPAGPGYSHRGSLGGLSGSLGLGSVQSHGAGSFPPLSRPPGGSATSSTTQKWWICQVCQSKAFASQDEALAHEAVCQEATQQQHHLQFPHHEMQRNFSMGFGMDSSQRSIPPPSMGHHHLPVSMIDNSSRGVVSLGMDSSRGSTAMGDPLDRSSRTMSLGGMDSSASASHYSAYQGNATPGPINIFIPPVALAMPSDKDWLTPLHCFVRAHCVEVFTATESDVQFPSKGKRKPIQIGQVGIRCPHCSSKAPAKARERGSVYFPTSISSIYNATMNLLQRHLHSCPDVPDEIMRRYETLKADDARSGTSKRYWIESALSLGLIDTPYGIRHSALAPPPLPSLSQSQEDVARRHSNDEESYFHQHQQHSSNDENHAMDAGGAFADGSADHQSTNTSASLLNEADKPYATDFSYLLMDQMQPCVFTEADRLGKRKGLPPGFPGLACRHCFGGYGSGRFFPSTIKTLSDTSKTLNVLHNHMMRCRKCPAEIKERLERQRVSHDDERAKMKFGSQKAFFGRIWERLHGNGGGGFEPRRKGGGKRSVPTGDDHMLLHGGAGGFAGGMGGLEALAAASTPSKRAKL
jgi:DNA-directed RNA polymerase subunit RPC12/RpoP